MNLNQTDLIVSNVPEATKFLKEFLELEPDFVDERFAQFTVGNHCLMLSPDAMVPMKTIDSGTILHFEVDSVDEEYDRIQKKSFNILQKPTKTDWGTYSLLVDGPDNVVFDFYELV